MTLIIFTCVHTWFWDVCYLITKCDQAELLQLMHEYYEPCIRLYFMRNNRLFSVVWTQHGLIYDAVTECDLFNRRSFLDHPVRVKKQ